MSELQSLFDAGSASIGPWPVLLRLLVALALGGVVAWVYSRANGSTEMGSSFPFTLAMLAALIAMVTQVVGDSVARAFSLVGALSIVRFRTVVKDTRDTAYVIFAVAVGMAVGAYNFWTAVLGLVVVGGAALIVGRKQTAGRATGDPLRLLIALGIGYEMDQTAGPVCDRHLEERRLLSIESAKKGTAIQYLFDAKLKPGCSGEDLVRQLNRTEGVYEVRLQRRDLEQV